MLVSLSIRDIVVIERLDLEFQDGLSALTGETGAGKSILLDALGLTLGGRSESRLLRPGSNKASVTAAFELEPGHPALTTLEDEGLDLGDVRNGELLILRRTVSSDGRSRAFVNGQALSVSQLRNCADYLIEIQGQFDQRGLLDPTNHRIQLDTFAGLSGRRRELAGLWRAWRQAEQNYHEATSKREEAQRNEAFLRHSLDELEQLAPKPGEASKLAELRSLLKNRDRLIEAFSATQGLLGGGQNGVSVLDLLSKSFSTLEETGKYMGESLSPLLESLGRAEAEVQEGLSLLHALVADMDAPEENLADVEDRYFTINDLSRKHACDPDNLSELQQSFTEQLNALDSSGDELRHLQEVAESARQSYVDLALALSRERSEAAKRLGEAVTRELKPLHLERALFVTEVSALPEERWGPEGCDSVAFKIATNPGHPPGPLGKIASGGELSRFLLALKVVLAANNPGQTLVFDEVDSGIGGATADAVGERLEKLARERQVLVVTHSPQVAARAGQHCRVKKLADKDGVTTVVEALDAEERREEIARMLSGAEVTQEARAAAARLIRA